MRITRPKTKKDWLRLAFALLVLSLAVYFCIIRPVQIRYERRQFESLYSQIYKLSEAIDKQVGQPNSKKITKDCGYAARVYGGGPLSCGTMITGSYAVEDLTQANAIVKQASEALSSSIVYDGAKEGFSATNRINDLGQDLKLSKGDIHCHSSFSLANSRKLLDISIYCAGPAMLPHYQLVK